MDNSIIQKISFEIDQINENINASSLMVDLCKIREPNFVEKCGISMILHSFYNGIENIMLLIIKNIDSNLPNGIKWHKELLDKAFVKTDNRAEIFRNELKMPLNEYLKFRHFVRHTYGIHLKWEDMKILLFDMNITWEKIKKDIKLFLDNN